MAAVILFVGIPAIAYATDADVSIDLSANVESVASNNTFTVTVTISENSNVSGGEIAFDYDTNYLEITKMTKGSVIKKSSFYHNAENGTATWAATTGVTAGGTLMTVTFKAKPVKDKVTASIAIKSISVSDADKKELSCSTGKGDSVIINPITMSVVAPESAEPGEEFTVTVNLTENSDVAGMRFDLVYDSEKLELLSEDDEDYDSNILMVDSWPEINFTDEMVVVSWAGDTGLTDGGTVLTVMFKVLDNASGEAEIGLENVRFYDVDGENILFAAQNATVTIGKKCTVTVDGETVESFGWIILGIDNNDGTYSLPEDVLGYYMTQNSDVKFVNAGKYDVAGGEVIETVEMNVNMLNGAQVRYGGGLDANGKVDSDNGLRFLATVDRSQYDGVSYGMKITAEDSDKEMIIDAAKWQNDSTFSVAITNMGRNNYNRNYTATPFVKVEYYDGTEKTIYSTESVTRSIYYVATGLLKTGAIEDDYGIDISYGLYDVLNAYINMVGIRLSMDENDNVTVRENGEGAYRGEVFFDVSSKANEDGSHTVTIAPITEDFEHPVTIMEYWDEFVRINNNNTKVRECITSGKIENGILTFTFIRPE